PADLARGHRHEIDTPELRSVGRPSRRSAEDDVAHELGLMWIGDVEYLRLRGADPGEQISACEAQREVRYRAKGDRREVPQQARARRIDDGVFEAVPREKIERIADELAVVATVSGLRDQLWSRGIPKVHQAHGGPVDDERGGGAVGRAVRERARHVV